MKLRAQSDLTARARCWGRHLMTRVGKFLPANPHADPDNVRHPLILLETALETLAKELDP